MTRVLEHSRESVSEAVEAVAREIFSIKKSGESSFLNLPLLYPDGSCVTVKIDRTEIGLRVSDNGFAYREIESAGSERSFGRVARTIADAEGVTTNKRVIFAEVPSEQLFRGICDVATASWRVADKVYQRLSDDDELEITELLRDRLSLVFGVKHLRKEHSINGISTTKWDVSAVVDIDGNAAVFHAVGKHPNSVYKTTTAFHDISLLKSAPRLVSVVRNKTKMGHNLALLAQAGSIIESEAANEVYKRAAW